MSAELSQALASPPSRTSLPALRVVAPVLVLGLLVLGWFFQAEITAAVNVWRHSTTYTHCFGVLPIALLLAYERRNRAIGLRLRPLPWLALLVIPLTALWLAAERLGVMEARQFLALACAELLLIAVLGWRFLRAFAVPLLFLVFLVPAGAFLTQPLQDFTAKFIVLGLNAFHIANFADAHTIEIPEGVFYVAEACAGLRFLVASVAFGTLYAVIMFRSPLRRVVMIAFAVVVPILANGVRALGIVAAGHWVGNVEAVEADHLIYGWWFFCFVLLLLVAAGLPFRQDGRRIPPLAPAPAAPGFAPSGLVSVGVALMVCVGAAIGPMAAAALDRAAAAESAKLPARLVGCQAESAEAKPTLPAELGAAAQIFSCAERGVRALVVAFPPRTNPTRILAAQRRLTGQDVAEDVSLSPIGGDGWLAVTTMEPPRYSATNLWINGRPASGLHSRLLQALRSFSAARAPVILAVLESQTGHPQSLPAFLASASGAELSSALANGSVSTQ